MYPLILLLLVLPATAWKAYVVSILWGWFVTPIFGMLAPSIWVIAGLLLIVNMTHNITKSAIDEDLPLGTKVTVVVGYAFLGPALVLLFGWFFKLLAGA